MMDRVWMDTAMWDFNTGCISSKGNPGARVSSLATSRAFTKSRINVFSRNSTWCNTRCEIIERICASKQSSYHRSSQRFSLREAKSNSPKQSSFWQDSLRLAKNFTWGATKATKPRCNHQINLIPSLSAHRIQSSIGGTLTVSMLPVLLTLFIPCWKSQSPGVLYCASLARIGV